MTKKGLYFYIVTTKTLEDPDTFSLDNIETDEEYETVTAVLDEILEDEE